MLYKKKNYIQQKKKQKKKKLGAVIMTNNSDFFFINFFFLHSNISYCLVISIHHVFFFFCSPHFPEIPFFFLLSIVLPLADTRETIFKWVSIVFSFEVLFGQFFFFFDENSFFFFFSSFFSITTKTDYANPLNRPTKDKYKQRVYKMKKKRSFCVLLY